MLVEQDEANSTFEDLCLGVVPCARRWPSTRSNGPIGVLE